MIEVTSALASAWHALQQHGRGIALVGGLAVSIRAEARFTRDVNVAIAVEDDADAESVVFAMSRAGYHPVATVAHEVPQRLATARVRSPEGVTVDLMFASCGIEPEIVAQAEIITLSDVGAVAVARAEELLAMKLLSMGPKRLQDRTDAQNLIRCHPDLDLEAVRDNLHRITARGYHRGRDLTALLDEVLREIA
jgi:hypothetical protein